MALIDEQEGGRYLTIVGGKVREKSEEGAEGAKLREGTLKDGTTYAKWEKSYNGVSGIITEVKFYDGLYGKNVLITIKDPVDETEVILSLGASNRNTGVPFLLALPNLDLTKEVTIKPYDFEDVKSKKRVSGLSIQQGGEKIQSAFYDPEKKKNLLGMPEPIKNKKKEIDWSLHFKLRDAWLQEYLVDNMYVIDSAPAAEDGDDF